MQSVEIPDETTFAAIRAFDGKQGYSKLERMRAALEAALPYLAPAGDYSQQEIEELISDAVPRSGLNGFTLPERMRIASAVAPVVRQLVAPAVPQPVDREALAICLHSFDGFAIETGEQWSECNKDRKGVFLYQADAVLALFGGSKETPGMKLSRLSMEANARNNGPAVLAGEQEQVEP